MKLPLKFKLWRRWNRLHWSAQAAIGLFIPLLFVLCIPLFLLFATAAWGVTIVNDVLDPDPPPPHA